MLDVENLRIDLATPQGRKTIVRGVSFALAPGGSLGVVGESGSGKTMTALALMGLLPEGARVGGAIRFEPGQARRVALIPIGGLRQAIGFQGQVMGALD